MIFGGRWSERQPERTAAFEAAANDAARDAESIVGRAWELELHRQYDRMLFSVRSADDDRAAAVKALAEAQREGEAASITAALSILARTVETAHKCSLAHDRMRQSVRMELDLLNRAAQARAAAELAETRNHGPAAALTTLAAPPAPAPLTSVETARRRGFSGWIGRVWARATGRRRAPRNLDP